MAIHLGALQSPEACVTGPDKMPALVQPCLPSRLHTGGEEAFLPKNTVDLGCRGTCMLAPACSRGTCLTACLEGAPLQRTKGAGAGAGDKEQPKNRGRAEPQQRTSASGGAAGQKRAGAEGPPGQPWSRGCSFSRTAWCWCLLLYPFQVVEVQQVRVTWLGPGGAQRSGES